MSSFKGLALSFAIITFLMVGVPILGAAIAWPDNCKQSIIIPCIGIIEMSRFIAAMDHSGGSTGGGTRSLSSGIY